MDINTLVCILWFYWVQSLAANCKFCVHFSVEKGRNFDSRPPKAALRAGLEECRLSRDGVGGRGAGASLLGPGLALIPGAASEPGLGGDTGTSEDMEDTPGAGEERGASDPPPPP